MQEDPGLKLRRAYNAVPNEFQKIQVGVFRLDDLIPTGSKIEFIKMDVEGGELDVLSGASRLLEYSRPIVAFECGAASFLGYHRAPEKIFNIFSALEYQIFSITGDRMFDSGFFSNASYAQNYWDYIALPAGKEDLARFLNNE